MSLSLLNKAYKFLQKFGEFVASVRLTTVLLFILIPVAILGSLVPQGLEYAEYARRFGFRWTRVLYQLRIVSVFLSPWFLILVALLSANILSCLIVSVMKKKRTFGFILVHLSLVLLIAGGMISATRRVREEIVLHEGETVSSFIHKGQSVALGFELRLKDFELERYAVEKPEMLLVSMPDKFSSFPISGDLKPGQAKSFQFRFRKDVWTAVPGSDYQFRVERFLPDFRYDTASHAAFSASEKPRNPAILVHMKSKGDDYSEWVFSNFSDPHMKKDRPIGLKYHWAQGIPKAFISHVEILEKGVVVREQAIRVNHPLRHKGFSFYQATYDSLEEKWSGLDVVRDPGTGVVFLSIVMIVLGLTLNIYFHPSRIKNRKFEEQES